jgi:hypothetical protein
LDRINTDIPSWLQVPRFIAAVKHSCLLTPWHHDPQTPPSPAVCNDLPRPPSSSSSSPPPLAVIAKTASRVHCYVTCAVHLKHAKVRPHVSAQGLALDVSARASHACSNKAVIIYSSITALRRLIEITNANAVFITAVLSHPLNAQIIVNKHSTLIHLSVFTLCFQLFDMEQKSDAQFDQRKMTELAAANKKKFRPTHFFVITYAHRESEFNTPKKLSGGSSSGRVTNIP